MSEKDERRQAERYDCKVTFEISDGITAESVNISSRGLYCEVTHFVPPFSKLRVALSLPMPDGTDAPFECDGVIVRVDPDKETAEVDRYCVAIFFLDLTPEQLALIETYSEAAA